VPVLYYWADEVVFDAIEESGVDAAATPEPAPSA
jgi:hypothetical protein